MKEEKVAARCTHLNQLREVTPGVVGDSFSGGDLQERKVTSLKRALLEKRRGLEQLLDELISRHGLDEAHVVGFTSMFMQNVASFAMARRLKARNPGLVTVMGGANCEWPMGQII